jgi:cytochrome c-type biogenesis protein CcmH/NrfG
LHFEAVVESLVELKHSHDRTERALFKTLLWVFGTIVLLVALATFGYRQVRNWQVRRLSAEANALVNRGDYKRAGLEARRILQIKPESAEGIRILARIAERAGSRVAIELWRRVVASESGTSEDYFELARTAIRFGDLKAAKSALEKLAPTSEKSAPYHALRADYALAHRDGGGVERELNEAVRLDPANKEYVFRLAALRLGASDSKLREQAQQTLKGFQNEKSFRREATRQLVQYALQRREFTEALTLGRQLNELPEKDFRDRLLLLTVLYEAKDPAFQNFLSELENAGATNPDMIVALIVWLNTHGRSNEAIAWSRKLRPELLTQKSVPLTLADAFISTREWTGLERLTKSGSWGEMDFLRMALHARALREMSDTPGFTAQWSEAVRKVSSNAEAVLMLSQTAAKWGWRAEAIALLWIVAKDSERGEDALRILYDHFIKEGDTQNLYRVLLHLHERRPQDPDIQNNLAQISLLLNLNPERGQKFAQDIYEKEPKNAVYVSTYAFALYARGEPAKALKLFSGLPEAKLREPAIALYYGIVLAAVGDGELAAQFLDLGQKGSLLPEEKALLEKARRSLAQR